MHAVDSSSGQLPVALLKMADGDPPINESSPSFNEFKEAVTSLNVGTQTMFSICNIRAAPLRASATPPSWQWNTSFLLG